MRSKKTILGSVGHIESISDILLTCENAEDWDWRKTSSYIREKSFNRAYLHTDQKNIHNVSIEHTSTQDSLMTLDQVNTIIDDHISQYGPKTTYNMLNVKQYRESLSIPSAIWSQLEPSFQEKINKIRQEIRSKREQLTGKASVRDGVKQMEQDLNKLGTPKTSQIIPDQYPSMKGITSKANTLCTTKKKLFRLFCC